LNDIARIGLVAMEQLTEYPALLGWTQKNNNQYSCDDSFADKVVYFHRLPNDCYNIIKIDKKYTCK